MVRPALRDPNHLVLSERPDLKRLFVKAALTARGRGGDLPATRVELAGQPVDVTHLARYARVCGFALSEALPPTFLHVLAFPLEKRVLLHADDDIEVAWRPPLGSRLSFAGELEAVPRFHPCRDFKGN